MRNLLMIAALVAGLSGCSSKPELPKLLINTNTVSGDEPNILRIDTVTQITDDYFQVTLASVGGGAAFIGTKYIYKSKIGEAFKVVWFNIVDKETDKTNDARRFKDANEFLNYMSARGYEMKDQQKLSEFNTDYTFKRKSE